MMLLRNVSVVSLIILCLGVPGASTQEVVSQKATAEDTRPGAITHDTAGKMECLVCHAAGATPISDVPGDHEGRGNQTCLWCHATDSPMLTVTPSATPHQTASAETDCMRCHAPGVNESAGAVPESHEGRRNETCLWCHKKVEGF
jgi:hypothetical protein